MKYKYIIKGIEYEVTQNGEDFIFFNINKRYSLKINKTKDINIFNKIKNKILSKDVTWEIIK